MKKLVVYTLFGCLMVGNSYSSSWGHNLQQTSLDTLATVIDTRKLCMKLNYEVKDLKQEITGVEQNITGVRQEITGMKQEMTKLSEMLAKFLEMQQNKEDK